MNITLTEQEVIEAIEDSIRNQGISIKGKEMLTTIQHTGGRANEDKTYSATVELRTQEEKSSGSVVDIGKQPAVGEVGDL